MSLALAVNTIPFSVMYYGTATLDGSDLASGTVIRATTTTLNSTFTLTTAGSYSGFSVSSTTIPDTITFEVISSVSGYDSVNSISDTTTFLVNNSDKIIQRNLAFTGTETATTTSSSAAGGGGGFVGAGEAAPTGTLITDVSTVSDVISSLPEGWTNVDVYEISKTSETVTKSLGDVLTEALTQASDTAAISALQTIKNKLDAKEVQQITVTKTLEVYKITNKDTGESVYRTKIKLTFTAPKDMKNVEIIEVVPKDVAQSSDDLVFTGIIPRILQKDPILQWIFNNLKQGETRDMTYIVKKKLDSLTSVTVAAGVEKPAEVVQPPPPEERAPFFSKTVVGFLIIVVIVLIGLIIYYVYTNKKKRVN